MYYFGIFKNKNFSDKQNNFSKILINTTQTYNNKLSVL